MKTQTDKVSLVSHLNVRVHEDALISHNMDIIIMLECMYAVVEPYVCEYVLGEEDIYQSET